jgi:hypothetical protein
VKEDFKATLTRLRTDTIAFESYFSAHREEYAGTYAWLSLQLQARVSELLHALKKGGDERLARLSYDTAAIAGELKRLRVFTETEHGKTHIKARRQFRDTVISDKYEFAPGETAKEKLTTVKRELRQIFDQLSAQHPKLARGKILEATAGAYVARMRERGATDFSISAKQVERHIGPLPRLKAGRKPAKKRS